MMPRLAPSVPQGSAISPKLLSLAEANLIGSRFMKLNGKPLRGPATYTLVLPRGDEETIVIQARAVLSYDEFHKLYPIPQPPNKIIRGGARMPDFEHPE